MKPLSQSDSNNLKYYLLSDAGSDKSFSNQPLVTHMSVKAPTLTLGKALIGANHEELHSEAGRTPTSNNSFHHFRDAGVWAPVREPGIAGRSAHRQISEVSSLCRREETTEISSIVSESASRVELEAIAACFWPSPIPSGLETLLHRTPADQE